MAAKFILIGCIHDIQVKNVLIWDAAFNHLSNMVQYKATELNINFLEFLQG